MQEFCARTGGYNIFGEANFRLVWGWSRLDWIGGKWTERDANGNIVRERIELRRVPKYFPFDRWYLETWISPAKYGTAERWKLQTIELFDGIPIPTLGPYPSRGEYELCAKFDIEGEFIRPTKTALEHLILATLRSREKTRLEKNLALERRDAKKDADWNSLADDVIDDATRAFHGHEFVSVAN